jgi:hypothetical protein
MERFNIYLCFVLVLGLLCGCHTTPQKEKEKEEKEELAALRVHMETNPDASKRTGSAVIRGITFNIEAAPFLTEANIKEAKLIDVVGGFEISIQFNRQGSWLLEQYTSAGRQKHLTVYSQWTETHEKQLNKGRWLASPFIRTHITDGLLTFTPDATREEAEMIVKGLNNEVKKLHQNELLPD